MSKVAEITPAILAKRPLFVFDDDLPDIGILQDALKPHAASLRISRAHDCVLDITTALRTLQQVNELVLVGYGQPGEIALGSFGFSGETLGLYGELVAGWKRFLAEDARIVLVGCAVGAGREGAALVDRLIALTGHEVIAPMFTIGGGSWNFGGLWSVPEGWRAYGGEL